MLRLIVLFVALFALAASVPASFYSYLPYAVAPRYQVPGPYVYSTGNAVYQSVEPVEEHGYKIVY